jgi:hypothetical protein
MGTTLVVDVVFIDTTLTTPVVTLQAAQIQRRIFRLRL